MKPPLVPTAPMLTRINVTPIIDVALVLVIILLITAPMLSVANLKLSLPRAVSRGLEDASHLSVTLSKTGQVAVNEQLLSSPDELVTELRSCLAKMGKEDVLVVIRADADLPHGMIRQVLRDARTAGVNRIGIAIHQKGSNRS